jgi:LEA14-like dessication related protein
MKETKRPNNDKPPRQGQGFLAKGLIPCLWDTKTESKLRLYRYLSMKQYLWFSAAVLVSFAAFFSGCTGTPPPRYAPQLTMVFDRIEASGPDNVTLRFFIYAWNPGTEGVTAELAKSRVFVNGKELSSGFSAAAETIRLDPGAREQSGAVCKLDLKNLDPSLPLEAEKLDTTTGMEFAFSFDGGGRGSAAAGADVSFSRVKEPRFSIVSIAVMQAELINTRFRVKIRIENPNPFPLIFSSFNYELYGHGRFWAGGSEADIYTIPENGEIEEDLFLLMNFINMRRDLLDQVIAMRNVRYRFRGTAEIGTRVAYLPSFTSAFDIQGDSEVVK